MEFQAEALDRLTSDDPGGKVFQVYMLCIKMKECTSEGQKKLDLFYSIILMGNKIKLIRTQT